MTPPFQVAAPVLNCLTDLADAFIPLVRGPVLVATRTMRDPVLPQIAAPNVLAVDNNFQMVGIDAAGIPAEVVENKIWRNLLHQLLVDYAVGIPVLALDSDAAVTV